MPTAKYRLHAKKVDRIAIVDRPAVPDAQILLFKRQSEMTAVFADTVLLAKQDAYGDGLAYYTIDGAVSALQQGCWSTIYDESLKDAKAINKALDALFARFEKTLDKLIALTEQVSTKASDAPSAEDIASSFKNSLATRAIYDAFDSFRSHMTWFAVNAKQIENADEIITSVIQEFKSYIQRNVLDLQKNLSAEKVQVEKSLESPSARLTKYIGVNQVLAEFIQESGSLIKAKAKEEVMTAEEIKKQADEQAAADAKAAEEKAASEKKAADEKAAADAKAAEGTESEKAAKLEARIVALEESEKAMKLELAKVEALKTELTKSIEDFKALITKSAEVEKSAKADLDSRLVLAEKAINGILAGFEALGKRMGMSTALKIETLHEKTEPKVDVFADALKGNKKK